MIGFKDTVSTLNGHFCQLSVCLMLVLLCKKAEIFHWKLLIACES